MPGHRTPVGNALGDLEIDRIAVVLDHERGAVPNVEIEDHCGRQACTSFCASASSAGVILVAM